MKYAAFGVTAFAGLVAVYFGTSGVVASGDANLFPYDDPAAVAAGKEIYIEACASCHGDNLEGQDNWRSVGEDGLRLAPPHDETGHTWHHPDRQLFEIVKQGTAALVGNGYESAMIGFGDSLSDTEILNVMAFIKSTWPEEIIEAHNGINAEHQKAN